MKRSRPPRRQTPLRRGDPPKRTGPLRSLSPRSAAKREAIAAASRQAMAEHDYRCTAAVVVPSVSCWGPIDPSHVIPRSVAPDLVDCVANIVPVCRAHHEWIHEHPDLANAVGHYGRAGDDLAELERRRNP